MKKEHERTNVEKIAAKILEKENEKRAKKKISEQVGKVSKEFVNRRIDTVKNKIEKIEKKEVKAEIANGNDKLTKEISTGATATISHV